MTMDMGDYARALDTVAWFLGKDGWDIVKPMIAMEMKKNRMYNFNCMSHDGMVLMFHMEPGTEYQGVSRIR